MPPPRACGSFRSRCRLIRSPQLATIRPTPQTRLSSPSRRRQFPFRGAVLPPSLPLRAYTSEEKEACVHKRILFASLLLALGASIGISADAISIDAPQPLLQLAKRLADEYGYLVTYEEAPVDPERETVKITYGPGRVDQTN